MSAPEANKPEENAPEPLLQRVVIYRQHHAALPVAYDTVYTDEQRNEALKRCAERYPQFSRQTLIGKNLPFGRTTQNEQAQP